MKFSESNVNVAKAYVEARKAIKSVVKDKKNGQFSSSSYATLDNILEVVVPTLLENDCVLIQELFGDAEKDNSVGVQTSILHSSGEYISVDEPLWFIASWDSKGPNKAQIVGIWITYLRRYALAAFLGIPGEEDTDGNTSKGNNSNKTTTSTKSTTTTTTQAKRLYTDGKPVSDQHFALYDAYIKAKNTQPSSKLDLQQFYEANRSK